MKQGRTEQSRPDSADREEQAAKRNAQKSRAEQTQYAGAACTIPQKENMAQG